MKTPARAGRTVRGREGGKMLRRKGLARFLLLVLGTVAASRARGEEDPRQKALELQRKAIACHEQKDWQCFLKSSRQAEALLPGNLRLVFNLACAESLTGDFAGAAKHLGLLLDRQLDLGIEGDEDLAPLRAAPEYAPVARRLAALEAPVSRSTVASPAEGPPHGGDRVRPEDARVLRFERSPPEDRPAQSRRDRRRFRSGGERRARGRARAARRREA